MNVTQHIPPGEWLNSIPVTAERLNCSVRLLTGLSTRPGRVTDLSDLAGGRSNSAAGPIPHDEQEAARLSDGPGPISLGTHEDEDEREGEADDEREAELPGAPFSTVAEELRASEWNNRQVREGMREPDRALAHCRAAATAIGIDNRAAFGHAMFKRGGWPKGYAPPPPPIASVAYRWATKTTPLFDEQTRLIILEDSFVSRGLPTAAIPSPLALADKWPLPSIAGHTVHSGRTPAAASTPSTFVVATQPEKWL